MRIEQFEENLGMAWIDALLDDDKNVLQLTLLASGDKVRDDQHYVDVANGVLEKIERLQGTLTCQFLGAARLPNAFPMLGFLCGSGKEAYKMHGALSSHFMDHPHTGYDIRYRNMS